MLNNFCHNDFPNTNIEVENIEPSNSNLQDNCGEKISSNNFSHCESESTKKDLNSSDKLTLISDQELIKLGEILTGSSDTQDEGDQLLKDNASKVDANTNNISPAKKRKLNQRLLTQIGLRKTNLSPT